VEEIYLREVVPAQVQEWSSLSRTTVTEEYAEVFVGGKMVVR